MSALLDALDRPHAVTGEALGSHGLTYTLTLGVTPDTPRDPAKDLPRVGTRVPRPIAVVDDVDAAWASAHQFRVEQKNDHGRGRSFVLLDERLYTRLLPRGWFYAPAESDIQTQWLDDINHAVRDAVELAAPQLALEVSEGPPAPDGRPTLVVNLSRAETRDPTRVPSGHGQGWRGEAAIESVEGAITLDAAAGVWRQAEIHVTYGFEGDAGEKMGGDLKLSATITPGEVTVEPPPQAMPVRERIRYEAERRRILDGLAAP